MKTKDETIKALKKDIKYAEKLLNNVFKWCEEYGGKDNLLYWSITRSDKQIKEFYKNTESEGE